MFYSINFNSNTYFILAVASLSFISVSILCDFPMLPDMYILLSSQEKEVHSFSWVDRCAHLATHPSKKSVCLGNTKKKQYCKRNCSVIGPPSVKRFIVGHVHKYQIHFWGFVQTGPFLSFQQYLGTVK